MDWPTPPSQGCVDHEWSLNFWVNYPFNDLSGDRYWTPENVRMMKKTSGDPPENWRRASRRVDEVSKAVFRLSTEMDRNFLKSLPFTHDGAVGDSPHVHNNAERWILRNLLLSALLDFLRSFPRGPGGETQRKVQSLSLGRVWPHITPLLENVQRSWSSVHVWKQLRCLLIRK